MARQSSVGARLVENFNLLFEYAPSKECSQCINEHMFLRPDKRSFFVVMSYILDLIDPCWKSKLPEVILTKQDERTFFTGLCLYLKGLKKDHPEADLPTLTPSSLVCFYGEKSRDILLKITCALMLRIMEEESFDMDGVDEEHNVNEYKNACEENCKLKNSIDNIRQQNAQGISLYVNIISKIISVGPWDDNLKRRLTDLNDANIISDISHENSILSKEIKVITDKLQPYFDHFHHYANNITCSCSKLYHCSSDTFSNICDVLCKFNKNVTEIHLRNLKCIAAIKDFRIENKMAGKINFDKKVHCELVNLLESKLCEYDKGENCANYNDIYSPLPVEVCSSPEISGFSPVIAFDWIKLKKQATKLKIQSFAENRGPVKIDISPIDPLNYHILSRTTTKQPVSNESVTSILQRLRSKATPLKLSKESCTSLINLRTSISSSTSSGFRSKECVTSCKRFGTSENFTPISKFLQPKTSQSTNRRQSMGFVKPSNCFVRKRLHTSRIPEKNVLNHTTSEAGKSSGQNLMDSEKRGEMKEIKSEEQEGFLHKDQPIINQLPSGQTQMNEEYRVLDQRKTVSDLKCEKLNEVGELKPDCDLDIIVQKMIENESSLNSSMSGFLDSSLSGVECLPSSSFKDINSQNSDNEDFEHVNDQELVSPQKASNISAIVSEMVSINNEFDRSIQSVLDEHSSILIPSSDSSSDESEDLAEPVPVAQVPRKSRIQQLTGSKVKTGRDSLGLLIERFKAIKKNCNM